MRKRQEETDRFLTRERILSAAKREFAERGYQGSRLGSIARMAKVNQALIHYYFESKDRLYVEVLNRFFGVIDAGEMKKRFNAWSLDPAERLIAVIYLMVEFHHGGIDPDLNRIVAREIAEGRENIKSLMSTYFLPRIETMEAIVRDGVNAGVFETSDTLLTVLNIISMIISYESSRKNYKDTPLFRRLYGEESHERFFAFVVEYVFKALKPEGKKLEIPVLPDGLVSMIDDMINEMKQRQKWQEI